MHVWGSGSSPETPAEGTHTSVCACCSDSPWLQLQWEWGSALQRGRRAAGQCSTHPQGPQGALREVMRALLVWHLHAQVHKGYLDDPRNTDNAWVETVAISVHFDTQNDVEMKRLNSVRGCHP